VYKILGHPVGPVAGKCNLRDAANLTELSCMERDRYLTLAAGLTCVRDLVDNWLVQNSRTCFKFLH